MLDIYCVVSIWKMHVKHQYLVLELYFSIIQVNLIHLQKTYKY